MRTSLIFAIFASLLIQLALAQNVSFLPHRDIQIGPQCCFVGSADFNGDGIPDIAMTDRYHISIQLGAGNGTFQSPGAPTPVLDGFYDFFFATADLNRDGKPDLIWSAGRSSGCACIQFAMGNGDGT